MAHTRRKPLVTTGRRALWLSWCVATVAALGLALLGLPATSTVAGSLQSDVTLSLTPSTQSVQPGGQFTVSAFLNMSSSTSTTLAWLDGARVATVDLYASSPGTRQVVWSRNVDPSRDHVLGIHALGTKNPASPGTRVDVDALVLLR